MAIDREQVLHVARLARLDLTEEEVERFSQQLGAILEAVSTVSELELGDVPPTSHPLDVVNVWREEHMNEPGAKRDSIGDKEKHGDQVTNRVEGRHEVHQLRSEHLIPFAVGKRLWHVIGLAAPERGSHADRAQTTILIYLHAGLAKDNEDNQLLAIFDDAVAKSKFVATMQRTRIMIDELNSKSVEEHEENFGTFLTTEVRAVLGQIVEAIEKVRDDA